MSTKNQFSSAFDSEIVSPISEIGNSVAQLKPSCATCRVTGRQWQKAAHQLPNLPPRREKLLSERLTFLGIMRAPLKLLNHHGTVVPMGLRESLTQAAIMTRGVSLSDSRGNFSSLVQRHMAKLGPEFLQNKS